MTDFDSARLAELRAVAEAATQGEWRHWNPATGPSHVTIGGMVAFESLQSATPFADDEVIPHWADAYHIATFDPPTVLALIAALESKTAEVDALTREALHALPDGRLGTLSNFIATLERERDEARAALERVRAVRSYAPECDKYDDDSPVVCGWKRTVQRIDAVLEALERADSD